MYILMSDIYIYIYAKIRGDYWCFSSIVLVVVLVFREKRLREGMNIDIVFCPLEFKSQKTQAFRIIEITWGI